eukprot:TRINITY_DN23633_c0_g1_i1.p1 TRINITY_DN23633_c0_g1~~TRINITY_DN23633_c0_g1_i1.p1  ORF type:complete len:305 (-),score=87.94 TRINITY_DN23633_c0_g1_i1:58-900(-)
MASMQLASADELRRSNELRTTRGYLKQLQETSAPKGATPPEGFVGPTKNTAMSDLVISFEMLRDPRLSGLARPHARDWFRCAGWCVSNEEMNSWLGETERGKAAQLKMDQSLNIDKQLDDPKVGGTWSFQDLYEIHMKAREEKTVANSGGIQELTEALQRLAGAGAKEKSKKGAEEKEKPLMRSKIRTERLREVCAALGGVGEVQFAEVLEMCGVTDGRDELNCEALAYALLDKIIRPPTSKQLLEMRKEAVKAAKEAQKLREQEEEGKRPRAEGVPPPS